MIELSIIIPHFNSFDMLRKLLDTIPSYDDLEVVVVDDRSDDIGSWKLLEEEYRSDRRLFFRNDDGVKSAGTCRNIGLRNASGRWVLFADADDFFIEGFVDKIRKWFSSDMDVVFFTPISIDQETGETAKRHLHFKRHILEYLHHKDRYAEDALRHRWSAPFSKLIRRELIDEHGIVFQEIPVENDFMFSLGVGQAMHRFAVSQDVIYCVVKHQGSLITTFRSIDYSIARAIERVEFLEKARSTDFRPQTHMFALRFYRRGGISAAFKFILGLARRGIYYRPPTPPELWRRFSRGRLYRNTLASRA